MSVCGRRALWQASLSMLLCLRDRRLQRDTMSSNSLVSGLKSRWSLALLQLSKIAMLGRLWRSHACLRRPRREQREPQHLIEAANLESSAKPAGPHVKVWPAAGRGNLTEACETVGILMGRDMHPMLLRCL